jgi:beta-lactam-binding protein with PASTA domain
VDSDKKAGELVGTSPPRGGRAVPGQLVSILVSNGSAYTEPVPEPVPVPVPPTGPPTGPPTDTSPGIPGFPGGAGLPPGWPFPGTGG